MELKDILAKCDHTLLAQTATWEEIKAICEAFGFDSSIFFAEYVA